ncbi:MAG TPA: zonular occludens toxin domain-containing protein [Trinickia sp.]|uniref:zonular occludens toxin domain-containing protein n=1 Tax=Trinickia sp. TaxID=2571163 RepID=UPI002D0474D4|nr:zonular occludens toxin domain-containing protein [Trinickia sp.]HVW49894.1 zonular occludens toxin domain-containing protein [Trinickia sp.]
MAINAYIGLMGSGKTYQAVTVIVDALSKGRKVVSNIDGLNWEEIEKYLIEVKKINKEKIGQLICVEDTQIHDPNFLPVDNQNYESFVKGGELVVIDEVWKFWGSSAKTIPNNHKNFWKMHRHFVDDLGNTCDLCIITQDLSIITKDLRVLIERVYKTKKLKAITKNAYVLEIFEGYRMTKASSLGWSDHIYDKRIFPLYKSYAKANAKEVDIDGRGNIWTKKTTWFIIFCLLCIIPFASYQVYKFFHRDFKNKNGVNTSQSVSTDKNIVPSVNNLNAYNQQKQIQDNKDDNSFKIVGVMELGRRRIVFLQNPKGIVREEDLSNCKGSGLQLRCDIDNQRITYYSNNIYKYNKENSDEVKANNVGYNKPINNTNPSTAGKTIKPN